MPGLEGKERSLEPVPTFLFLHHSGRASSTNRIPFSVQVLITEAWYDALSTRSLLTRSGVPLPELFMHHHHSGEFSHMTHQGHVPSFPFAGPLGLGFLRHDPGRVDVEGHLPERLGSGLPEAPPETFATRRQNPIDHRFQGRKPGSLPHPAEHRPNASVEGPSPISRSSRSPFRGCPIITIAFFIAGIMTVPRFQAKF